MPTPSDAGKENCSKFAKFCFKVIKNECSNIKRAAGIRKGYDATGEEPVKYLLEAWMRWRMRSMSFWRSIPIWQQMR